MASKLNVDLLFTIAADTSKYCVPMAIDVESDSPRSPKRSSKVASSAIVRIHAAFVIAAWVDTSNENELPDAMTAVRVANKQRDFMG